jgi:hypothetical protein
MFDTSMPRAHAAAIPDGSAAVSLSSLSGLLLGSIILLGLSLLLGSSPATAG